MPSVDTTIEPVLDGGERLGCVATITIDNPERRNAMTAAMYQAVPAACAAATAEPDLRAVVLRGAGDRAFSAGSDISEFGERRMGRNADGYDRAEHEAWAAIESLAVPVIASIRGSCRGGGVAIALHADLRIAADDATFSVPPANLGLAYPPEATRRLVAAVGPSQAKRLLFTAEAFDADRAAAIGLVDEVVAADALDATVASTVDLIARKAPLTHRASKAVVDAIAAHGTDASMPLRDLAPDAADAVAACYDSDDFREGVRSFAEKRPPRFRGR
ncbi:MAG: enoyl-CoA hydratase-related protein [Actinomycetota bacterium]